MVWLELLGSWLALAAVETLVGALAVLMEGKLASVALLFASCLVSKGVGVDGVRDSLAVLRYKIGCRCQKKSGRPACHTGLTKRAEQTRQQYLRCTGVS